jgi:3-deoxy-D-manno-octulosonate 8-phosphate phosphatase (KDO 8-P phosphatase)
MEEESNELVLKQYKVFILDVDGVMTDGGFYYSSKGKVLKRFGPDDADALGLIHKIIDIRFVSADKKGFAISKRRISKDMGYALDLVSANQRLSWITNQYELSEVIYMGDSFRDIEILKAVGLGITPGSASQQVKVQSDYTTDRDGGHGAVADACFYIAEIFGIDI